jgi:hypothetical protein
MPFVRCVPAKVKLWISFDVLIKYFRVHETHHHLRCILFIHDFQTDKLTDIPTKFMRVRIMHTRITHALIIHVRIIHGECIRECTTFTCKCPWAMTGARQQ